MCSWDNAATRTSATDAQAAYDAALAGATKAGSAVTSVAGLADVAAIARRGPAPTVTGIGGDTGTGAIFVRRGALAMRVGYHGGTTPTDAVLQLDAALVLGELPAFAR
jgi:hypothetical protein